MKITVFHDVMLCSHDEVTVVSNERAASIFRVDIYEVTRRHIQEDSNLILVGTIIVLSRVGCWRD
jgi:hypothetical protein